MANNCLITKLKSSVNNDNLVVIGHMRVKTVAGCTFNVVNYLEDKNITAKSINNDSINAIIMCNDSDHMIGADSPNGTVVDLSSKYDISGFKGIADVNASEFKYSPIISIILQERDGLKNPLKGDIADLFYSSPGIKRCDLRTGEIGGDIASIASKIGTLQNQELNLLASNIHGDLGSLLEYWGTECKEINIINTKITLTQATLNSFAAKGVTVHYNSNQVVG